MTSDIGGPATISLQVFSFVCENGLRVRITPFISQKTVIHKINDLSKSFTRNSPLRQGNIKSKVVLTQNLKMFIEKT